jgi:hypothetical protein
MDKSDNDPTERAGDGLDALRDELARRGQAVREQVGAYVDEHPLSAMAIAFGVGYLLSGALISRTTARVVSVGGRLLLGGYLRSLVFGVGPAWMMAALASERGNGADESHVH